MRDKSNVRRFSLWLLFLYVHVVVAADKPQLRNTELSQLVAAVQITYVQRIVDNGMQQLALVKDSFLFLAAWLSLSSMESCPDWAVTACFNFAAVPKK